ncbi:MAG: TonB-dependent siderophore receptor [Dysgonomonas sp.]
MKQHRIFLRLFGMIVLLLPITLSLSAQQKQAIISGRAFTSDGRPASNVNVIVEELHKGEMSDKQGFYKISGIPAGHYTVLFSSIGLQAVKVKVDIETGKDLQLEDVILTESVENLQEIEVMANKRNPFAEKISQSVAKLPLKDIENPQVYNTITKAVLKEQVVTDLNTALKNATGITRLWESTGRQNDGAEYYTMRGFSLQPTIINGVANISNGALDPANVENIEVVKGPSGTLYGGNLIYYGGLINVITKKPYNTFGGEVGYITGSYGLNRVTADINSPLSDKTSIRVNAAYHSEKSFQDQGYSKSFFIAPSFKFKASDKLTFFINTEYKSLERSAVPMIFLYRSSPVTFSNIDLFKKNYKKSYTSDDLSISNPTYGIQAQALYQINGNWNSQTIVSASNTKSDGYYHYLWDNANGSDFTRYISKLNSSTDALNVQQNFTGDHKFGNMRNRVVIGADYLQKEFHNNGYPWVGNGVVSLSDQTDTGILSATGVDALLTGAGDVSNSTVKIWSGYISDVINFTPQLSAMAGLRLDNYSALTSWNSEEVKNQVTFSQKLGLVYQPILDQLSIFANYMNGFQNLEPVAQYDNSGNSTMKILKPEKANQWEVGFKTNLYRDRLSLTASYYDISVSNKTMADPANILNVIQGGEVKSRGVEVSLIANPITGLNMIAGYSHNYNKITKDAADGDYVGLRSEDSGPANLFNVWVSYRLSSGSLKGWGVGAGANYASEYETINRHSTGSFALPSYTLFNALISYNGDNYTISLKGDNITNKKYFGGWSTVTPQKLRTISLALNYRF